MASTETWRDQYLQLIEDCEVREDALSDWERTFLDSLKSQFAAERFIPSNKQLDKLNEIWERVTTKGHFK